MTNDTSVESSYASLLESAKKCKFSKKIFLQNPVIKKLAKKIQK